MTGTFSKDVRDCVDRIGKRLVLIDGSAPSLMLIEHSVGAAVAAYQIKRIDSDYFTEE